MSDPMDNQRRQLFAVGGAYTKLDAACDLLKQALTALQHEVLHGLPIGHTVQTLDKALTQAKIARDNTWNVVKRMP